MQVPGIQQNLKEGARTLISWIFSEEFAIDKSFLEKSGFVLKEISPYNLIVPWIQHKAHSSEAWYSEFKGKLLQHKKKKIKLNLTTGFCNSHKDLCNVFLKLKWTIKSTEKK